MANANALPQQRRFGQTSRRDAWWIQPLLVFLGFSAFIVYSTWAAFQGNHYWLETGGANYLSPFYSPEIFGTSPHAWFGKTAFLADVAGVFAGLFFVLWGPGGFRFTCYYYRGAYYKGFWADPIACAVGEPRKKYLGEKYFPLILQNVHRYFAYLAVLFIIFLSHDAWKGMWFTAADGSKHFGVGVGNDCSHAECGFSRVLYFRLPFAAASGRRIFGFKIESAVVRENLQLRQLPQQTPHDVGVDQFVLGRVHRPLRPALLDGHLARL
jgi:hypothetical protein